MRGGNLLAPMASSGEHRAVYNDTKQGAMLYLSENPTDDSLYRAKNPDSGQLIEFTVANKADGINLLMAKRQLQMKRQLKAFSPSRPLMR